MARDRIEIERIPLDRQGYVKSGYQEGRYYGTGKPLFRIVVESPEGEVLVDKVMRADNRQQARQIAREQLWDAPRPRRGDLRGPRLPSRSEVARANAGSWTARKKLAQKYGLSGAAAAALGLQGRGTKRKAPKCKYGKVKSGPRKGMCRLRPKRRR